MVPAPPQNPHEFHLFLEGIFPLEAIAEYFLPRPLEGYPAGSLGVPSLYLEMKGYHLLLYCLESREYPPFAYIGEIPWEWDIPATTNLCFRPASLEQETRQEILVQIARFAMQWPGDCMLNYAGDNLIFRRLEGKFMPNEACPIWAEIPADFFQNPR